MAKYDPDALPFWENKNGDGPIAQHLRTREKETRKRNDLWMYSAAKDKVHSQRARVRAAKLSVKSAETNLAKFDACGYHFLFERELATKRSWLERVQKELNETEAVIEKFKHFDEPRDFDACDPDGPVARVGGNLGDGNKHYGHGTMYPSHWKGRMR